MPIVIAVLIALAIGFSGGLKWQDGKVARAEAKLEKAEALAKWNFDQAAGERAQKDACEANRKTEAQQALASLNAAQSSCQARVDQTNRSRDNLSRLLANAPKKDAKGCAARDEIVLLKDLVR